MLKYKSWPFKDQKRRRLYLKFEIKKLVLKSMINNFHFNLKINCILQNYFIIFLKIVVYLDIKIVVCEDYIVDVYLNFLSYLDIHWNIVLLWFGYGF